MKGHPDVISTYFSVAPTFFMNVQYILVWIEICFPYADFTKKK